MGGQLGEGKAHEAAAPFPWEPVCPWSSGRNKACSEGCGREPVFQRVLPTQCSWHLHSSPLYGIFLCQLTAETDMRSWGAALS